MPSGGGCWICNPFCGKCQPSPYKSYTCEDCGSLNVVDKAKIISGDPIVCKGCGKDIADKVRPKPAVCNYSGLICFYPCGKSQVPDKDNQRCERNTRPPEEWLEAHPKMRQYLADAD